MKKVFKLSCGIQALYCLGCMVVMVCMPLYSAFYQTEFGMVCFRIGAAMTLISFLNPMGLICTVFNLTLYLAMKCTQAVGKQEGWKMLAAVIVGLVLTVLCWYFAIVSFVYYSGGV